jgi:ankyrin repeat protein
MTPFHIASKDGHAGVVVMLRAGATIRDGDERTPLWLAARHDHLDVVERLIGFWADVNGEASAGMTVLMAASTNAD